MGLFPVWAKVADRRGHPKAFGILQLVNTPADAQSGDILKQFNELLFRQHSVSQSLRNFLKDKSLSEVISGVLKDVLELFHGGRVYIVEYDAEYRTQTCTYEVVAEGVSPEIDMLQQIPTNGMEWWLKQNVGRQTHPIEYFIGFATGGTSGV